ncbi:MAG TPA: serine/threonine-protein kinase [Candidatus Deferrimicrobium sp.]|nr:serine/threonine-protein kinase [Candidatus Deferrimicrobium sp.]
MIHKYSSQLLCVLVSLLVVILYVNQFGPLESRQRSLNDFLCRATAPDGVRSNVVLVTIDEHAQRQFGRWPWNRDLIADLLAATASGEPKAVAVDFELGEDPKQDSAGYTAVLAGQLTWIDNIILPYDVTLAAFRSSRSSNPEHLFKYSVSIDNPLGLMDEESSLLARKLYLPAEKLLESKPALGFNYMTPDDDRILRHQSLIVNYEGYYYPSLSLMAAAMCLGVSPDQIKVIEDQAILVGGQRRVPINDRGELLLSFSGADGFTTFSAGAVLSPGFNLSVLRDKLVIVGVDDAQAGETFRTPVQPEISESVINATTAENIINGNFLYPHSGRGLVTVLILLAIGVAGAFVLRQVSLLYRLIIMAVAFFLLANVNYLAFSSLRIMPDTMYIAFELFLLALVSLFLDSRLLVGEVESKRIVPKALPKFEIETAAAPSAHRVAVREIRSAADDPENVYTTAVESAQYTPRDYQAIQLEETTDASAATAKPAGSKMERSPEPAAKTSRPAVSPEIITPGTIVQSQAAEAQREAPEPEPNYDSDSLRLAQPEIRNLGRYQITGVLGKGAMGLVYKGIDPAINRPVALKTIRLDFVTDPKEEAELKERLHREAQAAGKLSHPNIVTIYDVGSEGHLQYIAMEFLEGQTLEEQIKKKVKFNYKIIAQMIIQICNALDYAHEMGIVHRDIKPANIMALKDYRVKVMDYGIARVDSSSMTKTGIAMGTPNYISPEQLKGLATDHRADLFSLGVVMYEMLLGRRPFRGENITSLIYSILNHEPEKPSAHNPQIPLLFDHIIGRALKKDPNDRYQHAREIAVDLGNFVESFAVR